MPRVTRRQSSITTYRGFTPRAEGVSAAFMNFRFNHLTQGTTRPNRLGCASEGFTNTNTGGRAALADRTGQDLVDGGEFTYPNNDIGTVREG